MKKVLALSVMIIILATVATYATTFPVHVTKITVHGNVRISTLDIMAVIPFHVGDTITASQLKQASQKIYDLGWFSEVVPSVTDNGEVTFNVKENPVIKKIEITGNINKESFGIFGITLFRTPIMPTDKIRQILRDHGVRDGKVLNNNDLKSGLQAVIDEYDKKGYALIGIGKVIPGTTLQIQILEGKVERNEVTGVSPTLVKLAQQLINVPLNQPVKKAQLQTAVSRLHSSVYFSGVKVSTKPGTTPDTVVLVWNLTERTLITAPVTITGIDLTGVHVFPAAMAMATLQPIPEQGERVDNYKLLTILKGLYDLYYRNGYVMVRLKVGEVKNGRLQVAVEEGKIGAIDVSGNERTQTYVIKKALGIIPGEIFNNGKLAVAYQQLMSLGYFKTVNIDPQWADDHVKLLVSVVAAKNLGGINGSLAFSPESGGLVGKLNLHQKDLFGTGQDLSLSYSRGLIADKSTTWDLGYSTIAFFRAFNRVGFDLYRKSNEKKQNDTTKTFITLGGKASVSYPWANYTDLNLSYTHETVHEVGSTAWTPIDAITIGFSYDDVNNPRFPSSGDRRNVSLEQAGGFAPGEEFTKIDLTWAHFTPIRIVLPFLADRDQTVAFRFGLGWGYNLPTSQSYTLGGADTVRGLEKTTVTRLAYTNLEYRVKLVEGLNTTLFWDSGVNLGDVSTTGIKSACGIEFGIEAAGMYVRLDVAWPIGTNMSIVPHFDFGFSPMF